MSDEPKVTTDFRAELARRGSMLLVQREGNIGAVLALKQKSYELHRRNAIEHGAFSLSGEQLTLHPAGGDDQVLTLEAVEGLFWRFKLTGADSGGGFVGPMPENANIPMTMLPSKDDPQA